MQWIAFHSFYLTSLQKFLKIPFYLASFILFPVPPTSLISSWPFLPYVIPYSGFPVLSSCLCLWKLSLHPWTQLLPIGHDIALFRPITELISFSSSCLLTLHGYLLLIAVPTSCPDPFCPFHHNFSLSLGAHRSFVDYVVVYLLGSLRLTLLPPFGVSHASRFIQDTKLIFKLLC